MSGIFPYESVELTIWPGTGFSGTYRYFSLHPSKKYLIVSTPLGRSQLAVKTDNAGTVLIDLPTLVDIPASSPAVTSPVFVKNEL